jgi:hypothetical protein
MEHQDYFRDKLVRALEIAIAALAASFLALLLLGQREIFDTLYVPLTLILTLLLAVMIYRVAWLWIQDLRANRRG